MSTRNLEALFGPDSIALAGASARPDSLGAIVLNNLRAGGFAGPIYLVNPRYAEIDGVPCQPDFAALPAAPDLVVVAVPPALVPGAIEAAGARGARVAVVLTAGLGKGPGSLREEALAAAGKTGLRVVGPNVFGVLAPGAGVNASFSAAPALPGDLALLSQSGAIIASLIDWANSRRLGFSGMVSLGDMADVDFGDLLDHFATDPETRAILLYVEAITDAAEFMSAARAAARLKPVVVVKAGRHAEAARAAASHTGALAGSDAVYDAAFRRAGLLRVTDLEELFSAAETLSRLRPFRGDRLAILTNGGGLGVLAVDRALDVGARLAELAPETVAALDAALPKTWSKGNPVDIIGDAGPERYRAGLGPLLDDPNADAVVVIHCPTALAPAKDCAEAVAGALRARGGPTKPVFAAWLGADPEAQDVFEAAGIPTYGTPDAAIGGFGHVVRHVRAQEELLALPPSLPEAFEPDVGRAQAAVADALARGQAWLDPVGVAAVLDAYGIAAPPIRLARSAEDARAIAAEMLTRESALAIKIRSEDIPHKSDVGGVRLGLKSVEEVAAETQAMLDRVGRLKPGARVQGVLVQPMIVRPNGRELIAGIADDPVFGPVILFGAGGIAVEVLRDTALALPPLHMGLAQDLIGRTRVSALLDAYRDRPAADREAVALTLVKLAQLAADLPEIREMDVNPLIADETGVIALDARIRVAPLPAALRRPFTNPRLAIKPYPAEQERRLILNDGSQVFVRPVRPEDEPRLAAFFAEIAPADLRQRFFVPVKVLPRSTIARFTQIDYARVMVLLAFDEGSDRLLGIVQVHADPDRHAGEYAILVRSDLKGRGLGWRLMRLLIEHARDCGLDEITGQVLRENTTMLTMCAELGFSVAEEPDDPSIAIVTLPLRQTEPAQAAREPLPA